MNAYNHQKGSLDLEFFVGLLILDRVIPQLVVEAVALDRFNDTRGEDLRKGQ